MASHSDMSGIAGTAICEKDSDALTTTMARWMVERIARKVGTFRIALSGGETPKALYAKLASDPLRGQIDWTRVEMFWGDERFVPHDDPRSNFAMARDILLSHVPIPARRIHPIPVSGNAACAAEDYAKLLQNMYGATAFELGRPLFDLVLLGLGSDGHTASLLPGQSVLDDREKWVSAVLSGREEPRITLTFPAIESSAALAFLVIGDDKKDAVRKARSADTSIPAGQLKPQGAVFWFLDSASAGA